MTLVETNYKTFVETIKSMVSQAQYEALKKVNKELINLYWNIGKAINEKQSELGWGKSVVEQLAKDLQAELLGVKGFSARNLWNMKDFYSEYNGNLKLQPLVAEISWTKNVIINKIESRDFERFALNQTNFEASLPEPKKIGAVSPQFTFQSNSLYS